MTTMDMIDEFARAALTGLLTNTAPHLDASQAATWAYQYAEKMAAERDRVITRRRQSARTTLNITNPGESQIVRRTHCFPED